MQVYRRQDRKKKKGTDKSTRRKKKLFRKAFYFEYITLVIFTFHFSY